MFKFLRNPQTVFLNDFISLHPDQQSGGVPVATNTHPALVLSGAVVFHCGINLHILDN